MQKVKNLHLYSEENLKARKEMERAVWLMTSPGSPLFKMLKAIKESKNVKNESR